MRNHLKLTVVAVLAALLVLGSMGAALADGSGKGFKKYHSIVDAGFVKDIVDGKVSGAIIDSRPAKKKYDKGHVPGAINIPTSRFDKLTDQLPADKSSLVVFYCGGLKCALSHKGAYKAEALGYTNVKVFATGYPSWKKAYGPGPTLLDDKVAAAAKVKGYKPFHTLVDARFVKDIVDGRKVGVVIDSRPKKKKYDKGHIPGSLSMPVSAMDKMMGLLPLDKHSLVVFYCGGLKCPLSHKAAYKAMNAGYSNVKVFAEGYPIWTKAYGSGPAAAAAAAPKKAAAGRFKAGKEEGSIDFAVFRNLVANKADSVIIVDVREAEEFAAGTLPGAVSVPTDKLEKKLASWKPAKPIIFICSTGARSGEAYYMVMDLRADLAPKVYYVDGELTFDGKGGYKLTAPK